MNNRQTELLKLIVEDYIKTARPIGSKSLEEKLKCSSATIRNEMSYLEDLGYLEKTHTSSGRIPSEAGYRYYVDNIMVPKELTGDDVLKLQQIFKNNSLILSDAIEKSLEIVSELTSYTIISLGNSSKSTCLSKVEVIPVTDNTLVAIIVTDTGHVQNRTFSIDEDISLIEIKQTVDLINKHIIGTPLDLVLQKLEFEVKPIINDNVNYQKKLFDAFCNFINDVTNDSNVKMKGRANILNQPEFSDSNKIKKIISKFEDENYIKHIKENENGINIYIGSETEFDDDVTIIKAKYNKDGEEGTIAIVGPKRMEYNRATKLLEYIKENIEKM